MRKYWLYILVFISSILTSNGQTTLTINDSTNAIYIGSYLEYISSKKGSQMPSQGYKKINDTNISLEPDLVHWFRFTLDNEGKRDRSFLLYFHNAQIDTAQYFIFVNDSLSYIAPFTGCDFPAYKRPTYDRTLSIPFSVKGKQKVQVYFKIYGREFDLSITPQLVDPINGNDFSWTTYLFLFLFVMGSLCSLVILVLAFYIKKYQISSHETWWFLLYILSGVFYLIATSGFGSLYVWGEWPWFEVNAAIFFGSLSCLSLLEFSRTVLNLKQYYKKTDLFFYGVGRVYISCSLLGFFHFYPLITEGFYKALITFPYSLTLISLGLILVICIQQLRSSHKDYFAWIAGFYFFHILFYVLIICLENNIIAYNYKYHTIVNFVCYVPQMFLALIYLVLKFIENIERKTYNLQNFRKLLLTEIHNEIGESLTKMKLNIHLLSLNENSAPSTKDKLHKISNEVTQADNNLRELYFSVNTLDEHFDHVQLFLKEVALSLWKDSAMQLNFDIHQNIIPIEMNRNTKAQLLMMYKEILNNIIKHAKATEVSISLNVLSKSKFRLLVRDNGVGFDPKLNTNISHGLYGLEYRARLIGGEVEIISKVGEGTTIIVDGEI